MSDYGEDYGRSTICLLVDALQEVPILQSAHGRNLVLTLLRQRLHRGFDVTEYSQTRPHLFSIVAACDAYRDGLQALARTLEEISPGTIAVDMVSRLITDMSAEEVLTTFEYNELLGLLAGVPLARLAQSYLAVLGAAATAFPPGRGDLPDMLEALAKHNSRSDGVPPLLVFAEQVASWSDPARAASLRQWTDQTAERMGLPDAVEAVRGRPELATPPGVRYGGGPLYLVLRIQPDLLDESRFVLSHWRHAGGPQWEPVPGEDHTGTLDEIRQRVAELVEQAELDWAESSEPIMLEFVLPRELLGLDVDQWACSPDLANPWLLGVHYQVVLRSLERMRKKSWHRAWRTRWRTMAAAPGGELVHRHRGEAGNHLRELEATLAGRTEICVLVLDEGPDSDRQVPESELAVALREGVPVIAWCRRPELSMELGDLVPSDGPWRLRERAKDLRGRAFSAGGDHIGAHVCLLWDDPDRVIDLFDQPAAPKPEVPA